MLLRGSNRTWPSFTGETEAEIDGPQAEQLEFVPCGQIHQDKDNGRREEKLSPAQIREKETTYSSFSKSRSPSRLHMRREAPWRSKGRGIQTTVGDGNLPIGLFARVHLG